MTEPRAAFQDEATQTDVQPNEADTVPAAEDETAESPPPAEATSDEAPAAEMDSDTTHEAPPPKADSGADDPPAAGSVPGALETFIAEDDDELPACPVCRLAIEPGADYVTAAYGPVHAEPCSHQSAIPGPV